jgi:hypothetical protein
MGGIPILKFLGLSTWEFWEKCHLGVASIVNHKEYYKGKVVISPKFGPWEVL